MPVTISGGIFNFGEGGYVPPTWSGSEYLMGSPYFELYQIYSNDTLCFAADARGLSVYDIATEQQYAYALFDGGFTTVGGNSNRIYLGTTTSGIKYVNLTDVTGSPGAPVDITSQLKNYEPRFGLTSSGIKYLHVDGDHMSICTNSGVEYISSARHTKRNIANTYKCFTADTKVYYITSASGIPDVLYRSNAYASDWLPTTVAYDTTSSGMFVGVSLNDMFITKNTGANGVDNCVFVATTSGVYVIDESPTVEGQPFRDIYYTT